MTPEDFQNVSGWSNAKISRELGVHRMSWYRWTRGLSLPAGRLLALALDALMLEDKKKK